MSDQGKAGNDHVEVVGTHDNDGDIAMRIFGKDAALPEEIDPAEERRLVRKIDWFIIPLIAITYLITYIDKATLSYAALFGMRQDVGLVGMDYSWLGSIFYFGYLFRDITNPPF